MLDTDLRCPKGLPLWHFSIEITKISFEIPVFEFAFVRLTMLKNYAIFIINVIWLWYVFVSGKKKSPETIKSVEIIVKRCRHRYKNTKVVNKLKWLAQKLWLRPFEQNFCVRFVPLLYMKHARIFVAHNLNLSYKKNCWKNIYFYSKLYKNNIK